MKCDIVLVGVGGQGILLASRVLGKLALDAGLSVKVSEVHGMSQRGGSVVTHVRIGEEILSPLVRLGGADAVIGLELLESARALPFLKPGGLLIAATRRIPPLSVLSGAAEYPDDPLSGVPAIRVDVEGYGRAANSALLGAFAKHQPFEKERWRAAIAACVPERTLEGNLRAFEGGWEAADDLR